MLHAAFRRCHEPRGIVYVCRQRLPTATRSLIAGIPHVCSHVRGRGESRPVLFEPRPEESGPGVEDEPWEEKKNRVPRCVHSFPARPLILSCAQTEGRVSCHLCICPCVALPSCVFSFQSVPNSSACFSFVSRSVALRSASHNLSHPAAPNSQPPSFRNRQAGRDGLKYCKLIFWRCVALARRRYRALLL